MVLPKTCIPNGIGVEHCTHLLGLNQDALDTLAETRVIADPTDEFRNEEFPIAGNTCEMKINIV